MMDGSRLQRVSHTKFMGVVVDAKLNWKQHVNYISLKISRGLGAITWVRHILPQSVLLLLYHIMIILYPYLSYCNIVWGAASAAALAYINLSYCKKELYASLQAVGVVHRQGQYLHVYTY